MAVSRLYRIVLAYNGGIMIISYHIVLACNTNGGITTISYRTSV